MVCWDEVKNAEDDEDEDDVDIDNRANNSHLVDCCICSYLW